MTVRVRIAPSPTGDPHVGTAFIALFNLAFARHHQGSFILRIEDTDQTRSRRFYEDYLLEALRWCGLNWDEGPDIGGPYGPYRQSERLDIYKKYAYQLLEEGKAYKAFTSAEKLAELRELGIRGGYDRSDRNLSKEEIAQKEAAGIPYVLRLKVPLTGECVYEDAIKGRVVVPWADVDDQVLLKSDGFPTYHLANVVDDHLMGISHVIRGDEWMSSTPKHCLLYDYFAWTPPTFMHMPLLFGTDGKKLSKRRNPTSIFYYRDSGYLPEAFINFLSLMGYSMADEKEIYSLDELIQTFDASRIGISGAVFDQTKLDWMNQQYIINKIPQSELWERIKEWAFADSAMQKLMPLVHTRIQTFGDFMDLCQFFFINHIPLSKELLCPQNLQPTVSSMILQAIIWQMETSENWGSHGINEASREVARLFDLSHKKVVMPILFATFTGKRQGPPLFDSVELLGKDRARARLLKAIEYLGGLSSKQTQRLKECVSQGSCSPLLLELEPQKVKN